MPKTTQGVDNTRYQVIPRTLTFVTKDRQVLLIKGAPNKRLWANLYNGIGGHVEKGEDVISAARREVLEESGLQVCNLRLCGTVLIDVNEKTGVAIYVYRGEYALGDLVHSDEGVLEWVEMDRLQEYPLVEDLLTLFPKVFEKNPLSPPFSALYQYDEEDRLVISFGD